jgi:single-strand DNA-binding protein
MPGFTLNHVAISGNLTRDPELRTLPSGATLCELRLAVNERNKDGNGNWTDRANYFNVTIWKGMGEWVAGNMKKGDGLAVTGRLRWHEWEKDGNKREAIDIIADAISVGRANTGSSPTRENPNVRQAHTQESDIPVDTTDISPTSYGDPEDDIPFAHDVYPFEFDPWHTHANR